MDVPDQANYKQWRRNRSMHTDEGTTFQEVAALIVPSFFYTVITTTLKSVLKNHRIESRIVHFLLEFTVIVLPNILQVTLWEQYAFTVFVCSFLIMLSLLIYCHDSNMKLEKPKSKPNIQRSYLTNSRSTVSLLSVIAILAVDFKIFPIRFYKTESDGISLMDVGAALFIMSNGLVAPEVKGRTQTVANNLKSSLPIFVLGIGRFLSVLVADYHVPTSEYGIHWNFFITIGIVKLFGSIILSMVKTYFGDRVGLSGLIVVILHEILLKLTLENYVNSTKPRDNFFAANKEGIVSSVGYLAIYLLTIHYSRILHSTISNFRKYMYIVLYLVLYMTAAVILYHTNNISRKLANAGFCFWIMALTVLMTGLFFLWEQIQNTFISKQNLYYEPEIFKAINYNPLVFFLLANILTGIINIFFDTMSVKSLIGLTIIVLYMLTNCITSCLLYYNNISVLKLIKAR